MRAILLGCNERASLSLETIVHKQFLHFRRFVFQLTKICYIISYTCITAKTRWFFLTTEGCHSVYCGCKSNWAAVIHYTNLKATCFLFTWGTIRLYVVMVENWKRELPCQIIHPNSEITVLRVRESPACTKSRHERILYMCIVGHLSQIGHSCCGCM